jgi:hypothetical protein
MDTKTDPQRIAESRLFTAFESYFGFAQADAWEAFLNRHNSPLEWTCVLDALDLKSNSRQFTFLLKLVDQANGLQVGA